MDEQPSTAARARAPKATNTAPDASLDGGALRRGAGLDAQTAPPLEAIDARDLLVLAFQNSPLGMTLTAVSALSPHVPRPRAFMVNPAFAEMIGYSVEELLANEDQGHFTHPDDRATDLAHLEALLAGDEQIARWDKRYLHADGHIVWGRVSVSLLRGTDGQPRYLIAQIEDVTERHEQESQLFERARQDSLTGLLNRSAFNEHAQEQISRCSRYGEHAGLLLIDLDDLKLLNDRYGHLVGDAALVAVADVLRGRLRTADVAARFGGDEFVVLLPHADRQVAQQIANDLADAIGKTKVAAGSGDVPLRVSIGSMQITSTTADVVQALAEADRDMYSVKRQRKGREAARSS